MEKIKLQIEEEFKKMADDSNTKGAACFKSIGFASCSDGISESQAQAIANRLNVSFTFHSGKTCNEITCKP